jgi:hypothetical protein
MTNKLRDEVEAEELTQGIIKKFLPVFMSVDGFKELHKDIKTALLAFKGEDESEVLKNYQIWHSDNLKRISELEEAIQASLNELGVPTPDYPAPIHNAVTFLSQALSKSRQGEK